MTEQPSAPPQALADAVRPTTAFRNALLAAALAARQKKAPSPERAAALQQLSDADLGALVTEFEALLAQPAEIARLADHLHAALRALAPEPPEEDRDADAS
jgi:hypothetical protein